MNEAPIYQMYSKLEETTPLRQSKVTPNEAETIRKVLKEVQKYEAKRIREGFNETNFTLGVLNCILLAFVFGDYPEHFWWLYLAEAIILIPHKIWSDYHAKPMNQVFYYMDYCWVMNFLLTGGLFVLTQVSNIPDELRQHMLLAVIGTGCGSLLGACVALPFVALVFHEYQAMTAVFIHLTPLMLVYTFLWHSEEIKETWPSVFKLDMVDSFQFYPNPDKGIYFFGSVVGDTLTIYGCWFVLYCIWMMTIGLNLPRKSHKGVVRTPKYDTVFHSTVRGGLCEFIGKVCWGRSKEESHRQMAEDDYETRDFVVYMLGHAVMVTFAITVVAYACTRDQRIHGAFIWALVAICVARGAKRYVYWATSMSSRAIEKHYREILESSKQA